MATLPAGWKPAAAGLAGRTVLIVGATGGLGRASALACAEAEGMSVQCHSSPAFGPPIDAAPMPSYL